MKQLLLSLRQLIDLRYAGGRTIDKIAESIGRQFLSGRKRGHSTFLSCMHRSRKRECPLSLPERLLERKFRAFEQRLERAEQEGRITATERLSWTITLQQNLSIDKRGRVSETVPDRRLACLEAVPLSRLAPARPLDAAKLQAFRGGGELPDPVYAPVWKAFVAKLGEGPGRRGLFADMLAGEPALLADAAEVFATAGQQAAAARGRSLGGVFDRRAQDLITEFAGTVRKLKPVPGQRYTDVNDERILGRLTALLFVSSELPEHLPTPTLSWVWNASITS